MIKLRSGASNKFFTLDNSVVRFLVCKHLYKNSLQSNILLFYLIELFHRSNLCFEKTTFKTI